VRRPHHLAPVHRDSIASDGAGHARVNVFQVAWRQALALVVSATPVTPSLSAVRTDRVRWKGSEKSLVLVRGHYP